MRNSAAEGSDLQVLKRFLGMLSDPGGQGGTVRGSRLEVRCSALLSVLSVSGKAEPCGINLWIAVQDYVSEFSSALSHNPRLSPFF